MKKLSVKFSSVKIYLAFHKIDIVSVAVYSLIIHSHKCDNFKVRLKILSPSEFRIANFVNFSQASVCQKTLFIIHYSLFLTVIQKINKGDICIH